MISGQVGAFEIHDGASQPNEYLRFKICSITDTDYEMDLNNNDNLESRTELDSHANMVVLGKNSFVFDSVLGKHCDVQPFDPTIGQATKVPIVDTAIAYDCSYTHKTYLLVARNILFMPSMKNNLIPPFIL